MDNLIQDLQKTIEALEKLSEARATAGEEVDELLDQLFQQKIDLVGANLNVSSQPFQQARQALKQAATKSEQAVTDPGRLGETLSAVSAAITKLARLLDTLVPSP